jgi:phosphoribosylaminoimidazole (AIR) synthetase
VDCTPCREAVSARLDGEKSPTESSAVDAHLATCLGCRQFDDDAAQITKLARCATTTPAPDVSAKVLSTVDGLGTVLAVLTDLDRHSTACATAMMAHTTTDMLSATRAALDCADIAAAAHRVLSRDPATDTSVLKAILHAAATAADRCAIECGHHAIHHSHCRDHSKAARHAAQLCRAQLHHITS